MLQTNNIDCSIVVPVYFNEGSLEDLVNEIKDKVIIKNPNRSFELIFVDDGSRDNSLATLLKIQTHSELNIRIAQFTRNFGQVSAILAGYQLAQGEVVINISADLQDSPQLMNEMLNEYFEHQYHIVICTREERDEGFYRKATSKFFYKLMQKLSFKNMPIGGFDFVLISNRVKNLIINMQEANPFWQGQILWTGFVPKFIPYTRQKRKTGKSRWSLGKKIKYLIDGVLSYSYLPLRAMSVIGIITFLLGFLYAIIIIGIYFFDNTPFKGWAPIMIIVLLLSGIQMLMLGIIGEYVWRTLEQVKNRSPYIIKKVYEKQ